MRISSVQLKNFKRFTDLGIENIPQEAKLVLLIGSNGSGKSSVFDAFGFVENDLRNASLAYYAKDINSPLQVIINDFKNEVFSYNNGNSDTKLPNNSLYGRTSFRHIPRLTQTRTNNRQPSNIKESPLFFIDKDNMFESDIEIISGRILKDVFRNKTTSAQIQRDYIEPVNNAFEHIFGTNSATKLTLLEIIPPLDEKSAQINFRKGSSEIHYNLLSAGEKEITNILFDLLVQREQYNDTIYFLDELDLHLNTRLQYNLIKEITENWIPANCQLWTASHSLGFIEYARQSKEAVMLDFDDLDFDLPQVLTPVPKENPEIYDIAVGKEFLPALFKNMNLYFVENKDKDYYAGIGIANTIFVSDNNRNNVFHKVRATNYNGIVDRDFLSDDDIAEIRKQYPNLFILDYYSIENYFYHPDNLEEYYRNKDVPFDKARYIADLTNAKNEVKDKIIPSIALKRTEYAYFGEPEFNGTPLQNKFKNKQENQDQAIIVAAYLNSNDIEQYYKSLPMKSYCTNLSKRQNIAPTKLARTNWFRQCFEALLKKR